jgi:uncharacterized Zn finger protein
MAKRQWQWQWVSSLTAPEKVDLAAAHMNAQKTQRFDTAALRGLAGATIFARGSKVEILEMDAARVVARVAGSETYLTVVSGKGERIGGECSCRAFEDWGFCKPMVAVALTANAAADDGPVVSGTPERKRCHLQDKGIEALVEMIMDLAERDAVLYRKLDLAASARFADEQKPSLRQARRVIQRRFSKSIPSGSRNWPTMPAAMRRRRASSPARRHCAVPRNRRPM